MALTEFLLIRARQRFEEMLLDRFEDITSDFEILDTAEALAVSYESSNAAASLLRDHRLSKTEKKLLEAIMDDLRLDTCADFATASKTAAARIRISTANCDKILSRIQKK